MKRLVLAGILLCGARASARADGDDGYCEHAKGVAKAESSLLVMPSVFGSFGYVDQPVQAGAPEPTSDVLRITAGVRYSLGGLYTGMITKQHGADDCKRHHAFDDVTGATTHDALAAESKVLDDALDEASKILDQALSDLSSRRVTAQDVEATRIRVDELRALADKTRHDLDALPPSTGSRDGALAAFYAADAALEKDEGKLRAAQGWDVEVRFGYDQYSGRDTAVPYFGVVQASFNLGWLFESKANKQAAEGRRRMIEDDHEASAVDTAAARLSQTLDEERDREKQTGVLAGDLAKQLKALARLGGDDNRRYRDTVWFDYIKVHAENEYLKAHVASLEAILGKGGEE